MWARFARRSRAGLDGVERKLGEHAYERFVEAKGEEWDEYRMQVSGREVERYLEAF